MNKHALCTLLVLAACKKGPVRTDAGAPASIDASKPIGFAVGAALPPIEKKGAAKLDEIGPGSWITFGPKGDLAVYGDDKTATLWPRKAKLPLTNVQSARFSPDGQKLIAVTSRLEFAVLAVNDLHVIEHVNNAEDAVWTAANTIAFSRDHHLFVMPASKSGERKFLGPKLSTLAYGWIDRVAPDLSFAIVRDDFHIRRFDIEAGTLTLLAEAHVYFSAGDFELAASPDGKHGCALIWLRRPPHGDRDYELRCDNELVTRWSTKFNAGVGFLGPTRLWLQRQQGDAIEVVDLDTKTIHALPAPPRMPGLHLLPGGRIALPHRPKKYVEAPGGFIDLEKWAYYTFDPEAVLDHAFRGLDSVDDSAFGLLVRPVFLTDQPNGGPGTLYRVRTTP